MPSSLALLDQQTLVDHVAEDDSLPLGEFCVPLGFRQGRVRENLAATLFQRALVLGPKDDPAVDLDDDFLKDRYVGAEGGRRQEEHGE